jgi:hypothetical protein
MGAGLLVYLLALGILGGVRMGWLQISILEKANLTLDWGEGIF